jgi:predicted alpha-1,6-mannanase (GH76 family)
VVRAAATHLTLPAAAGGTPSEPANTKVLRCDGTGDGGLFTGVLTRYLALAANDQRLPRDIRTAAAGLVAGTADALWAGRRPIAAGEPLARHGQAGRPVFSFEPRRPAGDTYPPGAAVELSTQLQAWMALESAASLQPAAKAPGN